MTFLANPSFFCPSFLLRAYQLSTPSPSAHIFHLLISLLHFLILLWFCLSCAQLLSLITVTFCHHCFFCYPCCFCCAKFKYSLVKHISLYSGVVFLTFTAQILILQYCMISCYSRTIHFDNHFRLSKMPDANSLDHHNQKPSLSKSNRLPPSSHPILYPSSAPANITTFSSSGSFSSNAAAPSVPSRQSWAANMVQHRHLAKKKGIEEKFNQSVKEAVRRENMQSHDGLYTNAILASPSSGDTGDNDVGGEEMQVDHQGRLIYTQNCGRD